MNLNFLTIFFLQSNNTLNGIGAFIIYLVILIVIFFLIREILMWYWKINERISNQNDIKKLLKETNSILRNISNQNLVFKPFVGETDSINETKDANLNHNNESISVNQILDKYEQCSNQELFDYIKNNKVSEKTELLTIIGILRRRKSQIPFGYLDKIRKELNIDTFEEFWIEVDKLA